MAGGQEDGGAGKSVTEHFETAHKKLLEDTSLQFKFETAEPPPPPPDWLADLMRAIGAVLEAAFPLFRIVFWIGLAVLIAMILWMVASAIYRRLRAFTPVDEDAVEQAAPEPVVFQPERARARALLEEADRLAKEGRFAEAARVLLHRTIEDMERALSLSIGTALTSREIGRLEPLTAEGRTTFEQIARAVEISLFGGRPMDGAQFAACREAYTSFAFGSARR